MNIHWSRNALDVRILGVNAVCFIPLILMVLGRSFTMVFVFFSMVIYFVITENILKLRPQYTWVALRFLILGSERNVKTRELDF